MQTRRTLFLALATAFGMAATTAAEAATRSPLKKKRPVHRVSTKRVPVKKPLARS